MSAFSEWHKDGDECHSGSNPRQHFLREATEGEAGRSLIIIHLIVRTCRPLIPIFSYTSRNSCPVSVRVSRMTERRRWVLQWLQSQATDFCDTGILKWSHGTTYVSIPEVNMLKNSSTLAVSVPINLSIKLAFVSVNGLRETYFVDMMRNVVCNIRPTQSVLGLKTK